MAGRDKQQRPPGREDAGGGDEAPAGPDARPERHHPEVTDPHLVGEDLAHPIGEAAAAAHLEAQAARIIASAVSRSSARWSARF